MNASNFIIIFEEKEGTSILVRILNNFERVSVVHQVDGKIWEPFDKHSVGKMPLETIGQCFDLIYANNYIDMPKLNKIYTKTASKPLAMIDANKSIGLKMRFRPKINLGIPYIGNLPLIKKTINPFVIRSQKQKFKNGMIALLKKHKIVTFITIRQDTFRLALSKYHGDGSGAPGHLQFKLAAGSIKKEDIPKIHVDCDNLERIITRCEILLQRKKDLMLSFKHAGIKTYPLKYEDFCQDKFKYFQNMFNHIGINLSKEEINSSLEKDAHFKKVHSDDISRFVANHEEVIEKFGDRFTTWDK